MSIEQESRYAFDSYAGMGPAHLPEDRWSATQVLLARWEIEQFGYQLPAYACLGVGEEAGELLEAQTTEEVIDAVGDVLIFAAQLCTHFRVDLGTLVRLAGNATGSYDMFIAIGKLNHAVLKSAQRIRGYDDRERARIAVAHCMIGVIRGVASFASDLDRAFFSTAETVMKRNWKINTQNGAA